MLYADDARTIADKIDDFRPYMLRDLDKISDQIYESAKRGEYETTYEVSYEDEIFVKLLEEELKKYRYDVKYRKAYIEEKGVYTVIVKWDDDDALM